MFGITENGDASVNYEWKSKINEMDGSILITKKLTDMFVNTILDCKNMYKFIVHVSCTGYGKTVLEPNLDDYKTTIDKMADLISNGFPAERLVLRVDPIIPTDKGLHLFENVIRYSREKIKDVKRIRVSVMDMYPHVRARFENAGLPLPYGNNFQASKTMFDKLNTVINRLSKEFDSIIFETCTEKNLSNAYACGCVSKRDYEILNIECNNEEQKGQRKGCLCLGDKKDMLTFKYGKTGYNHCYGCLYCYWQTEKDKR